MKTILTTALLLTGITFGLNNTASADQIDELTYSLDRQVQELESELAGSYRNALTYQYYRYMSVTTKGMLGQTARIRELPHDRVAVGQLQAEARKLESQIQYLESLVNQASSSGRRVSSDSRNPLDRGVGRPVPQASRRIRARLGSIEATIQQLQFQLLKIIQTPRHPIQTVPASPGRRVAPGNRP